MASKREKIKFVILRTVGNFLILFALFGMAATFGPAGWEEVQYRYNQYRNVHYVVAEAGPDSSQNTIPTPEAISPTPIQQTFFGSLTGGNKVEQLYPLDPNFGIVIPKIGANSRVVANVDPTNETNYLAALRGGVAHAEGTGFPGGRNNIYLFAHSTDSFWNVGRYNAVFYLLKELENGDEIDVFYQNVRHIYKVVEKKVVSPGDVKYLTEQTAYEQLTLQTCWPPGTTLERLLVIARPESDVR